MSLVGDNEMSRKAVLKIHIILGSVIAAVILGMIVIRELYFDLDRWIIDRSENIMRTPKLTTVEWIYTLCIVIGCLLLVLVIIFTVQYNGKVVKYENGIKAKYKETDIISRVIANLNPEFVKRAGLTFKQIHEDVEDYDSKEMWVLINEILKQKEMITHDRRELYSSCLVIIRPEECSANNEKDQTYVLRKRFSETYNAIYGDILQILNRMEEFFCRYDHMMKCKVKLNDRREKGDLKEASELEQFIEMEEQDLQKYFAEAKEIKADWKILCEERMERLNDYAFMYNYEREKKIHELVHRSIDKNK